MYSKICLLINVILMELRGIISKQDLKAVDLMQFSAEKFKRLQKEITRTDLMAQLYQDFASQRVDDNVFFRKRNFLLFNFPFIVCK